MAQLLASLAIGTLFGAGLAVSEMIDPARVIGFLDMASRRDRPLRPFIRGCGPSSPLEFRC